jgi:Protein of unknown function (DUF938)
MPVAITRSSRIGYCNRDFILDVLRDVLPMTGVILEIASGSGDASFILREISRVSLSNLPILNRKPC